MNSELTGDGGPLDALFTTARRHESALRIALQVGDDIAVRLTAARLALTVGRATETVDAIAAGGASRRRALLTMFQESTQGMHELVRRVPPATGACTSRRMTRWLMAPGRSTLTVGGPDLYELDATGVALQEASFLGLHLARCRLITNLHRASFADVFIDRSDLTYSNLRDTLWQRAQVQQSFLRDSSLVDAAFDQVVFVDCDLRRADFTAVHEHGQALTTNVQFLRCDLRGVNWSGRDLSRVTMQDCQLDGAPAPCVVGPDGGKRRSAVALPGATP